ncbi:Uncharacterised protein [Vibrio cholerae]|nr:Uncharacterised protein [Vibrio cholerae]
MPNSGGKLAQADSSRAMVGMSNFSTCIFIEFTSVLDVDIDPK